VTIDSKTDIIPVEAPQIWPVHVDELDIIEKALKNRPEIKKAVQDLRIRQVEEDLTARQTLPNLDVFGRYSVSGYDRNYSEAIDDTGFDDDSDAWAVGLNFEIPIGNRSAKSLARKRTLERKQASAQLEREKNQIKLDVKQVILAILYANGEIESTRLAMEAANKVVAGEFTRFDIGQTTNEELLRSQDLLAATSRNFMRAVVDNNIAIAELARVQGILPEGVVLEYD
jgi:outer membrane protein TolC